MSNLCSGRFETNTTVLLNIISSSSNEVRGSLLVRLLSRSATYFHEIDDNASPERAAIKFIRSCAHEHKLLNRPIRIEL
jgi:hypothetical protein